MIDIYFKTLKDENFQQITDFRPGSWINLSKATIEDLKKIAEITHLELEDLQDSLDKYESPRIELKGSNTLIFVRHPSQIEEGLYTYTMAILLTPSFLITISPDVSPLVDWTLKRRSKLATKEKSKLLFYMLLDITQNFTNNIKQVSNAVIEQKGRSIHINNASIVKLTNDEDILNQYLAAIIPMRNLLQAITSGRYVELLEKDHDILQDLLVAFQQSEDICRVNVKSIRSLRDSYQILFTNDVNKTIKLLTAITIIFAIPTIITSIYGMNIAIPMQHSPYAFIVVINMTIVLCVISLFLFSKRGWL